MTSNLNFKKLRELAEKATPGPWEYREEDGNAAVCHRGGWVEAILPSGMQENADAAYCAAANPSAVLTLLDDNETLRAVLQDIMALRLIFAEYPLLMARAKAALDGGGA